MGTRRSQAFVRVAIVSIATLSMVAACGSDDSDSEPPTPTGDVGSTEVDVNPDEVDPGKVVLASVLLTVGDVDVALSEGLVTADEVDEAVAALEGGTLDVWMDRAVLGD